MFGEIKELRYHQVGSDPMNGIRHASSAYCNILQIVEGSGSVVMNNRLFPLAAGSVFLIDAGCVHSTSPKYADRYMRNKIIIKKRCLQELLSSNGADMIFTSCFGKELGGCYTLPNSAAAEIDRLFAEMAAVGAHNAYGELLLRSNVMKILYMIAVKAGKGTGQTNEKVSDVLFYIDRNFTQPLSLDCISDDTHISKYYLSRLFRSYTGMSVFEYITERRISLARELLTNTDGSVAVVAGECGFDSISYFCHTFKRLEGMSPLAFRKKSREMQSSGTDNR
jgi:AraC family transcriptional regulator